jgi:nucleoside phosphorylase
MAEEVREYFDVAIIVPLEEELHQVMDTFDPVEDRLTDTEFRYIVSTPVPYLRVLVAQQEDMGRANAIRTTSNILRDFDVGLLICIGIAGGVSKDMFLGDVCYSGNIIDILDNSKTYCQCRS